MHGSTTRKPNTDCTDLAWLGPIDTNPHAGVLVEAADIFDAELGETGHDHTLDRAHVLCRAHRVWHVDDRIADELARTVIGHIPASPHRHEFGADGAWVNQDVDGKVGAWSVGEDVRMLEEQQMILDAVTEQRLLHRERLAVGNPPEPANAKSHVTTRRPSRGSPVTASS